MCQSRLDILREALRSRILVLDGSLGVSFQNLHLSESQMRGGEFASHPRDLSGNFDILNLTAPDIVESIHRSFLEAGADIIETNTFNSQTLSQEEYATSHLVARLNTEGARIARCVADEFTRQNPSKPRFVAGSIGPTAYTLSMSGNVADSEATAVDFAAVRLAMAEQAQALISGGVDFLLIETIFDALNVKATMAGIADARSATGIDIPVALSMTLSDASRRLLTGMTPEAFLASQAYTRPIAVGFNCSGGPASLVDSVRRLNEVSPFPTILYPNAGLPDGLGHYSESPEAFVSALRPLLADGQLNIVGGCCGTTPAHIAALAAEVDRYKPRVPSAGRVAWLAGLEAFEPRGNGFINVGERCNVAGSRKFLRLIKEKAYAEAVEIAVRQVRDGAMILDINLDDAMLDSKAEMAHFLRLLSADAEAASVAWMIDSSSFDVIETALQNIGGKAIVNSISLKHGADEFLRQADIIRSYGAAVVVMLFDEEGQATDYDHKIRVARRAYDLLTSRGWDPRDIIIDPNILTIATGIDAHASYGIDFIEAVRWIKRNLPGARTSGGVSNLSFAFRGNNYIRQAMHAVFLYHAIAAGLDMAIVDPNSRVAYSDIAPELLKTLEDVILCRTTDATDRLSAQAAEYAVVAQGGISAEIHTDIPAAIDSRLIRAIMTGDTSRLAADIPEAVEHCGSASRVIADILMVGMEQVGCLFGEGKLFLPQVIKSARCMAAAVELLRPYMERDAVEAPSKGRIVVATVRGDVHDIGKNIAAVVMRCNNFEVIDLGVQVEASAILDAVRRYNPDFVGLSGLITPSLHEMEVVLHTLRDGGVSIPVLVGGAATSPLHTALKLAPEYPDGVVVHVADAAKNGVIASRLLADYTAAVADIKAEQQRFVADHLVSDKPQLHPVAGRLSVDWSKEQVVRPSYLGSRTLMDIKVADVTPYINWIYFLNCWRVRPATPEAEQLLSEAQALVDTLGSFTMQARVGFFGAMASGDTIRISDTEIPAPRQRPRSDREVCLSLADFINPAGDYIGAFCVSIGEELRELHRAKTDDYSRLLLQSVCDRLAEATSEYLHRLVRTDLWGYSPDEPSDMDMILRGKYRGIRPAVGYGCLPDQSVMHKLSALLGFDEIRVEVTANGALMPASSVAGFYISSPHARYFTV
ncbi:MAG: methionine synthase [Paramuribaculum sp.]|nr:methionine synthase [Paramuribaculum sp.]